MPVEIEGVFGIACKTQYFGSKKQSILTEDASKGGKL
jgi:hypothetical protein